MMILDAIMQALIWLVNGVLIIVYISIERIVTLALLPALWLFIRDTPKAHYPWALGAGALAAAAGILAPSPAPTLLMVMVAAAFGAVKIEKFDPIDLRWRSIGAIALYSMIGLGFWAYAAMVGGNPLLTVGTPVAGPAAQTIAQGSSYVGLIAGFALWVVPVGYLMLIAQRIWIHAPMGQTPEQMINTVRNRNQRRDR
jgi:hypothetical protein